MRKVLIVLILFNTITALGGGLGLLFGWIDTSKLEIQPRLFTNAVVPSFSLIVVVGGSSLAAGIALLRHKNYAFTLAFISSLILEAWIITEMYLVARLSWVQIVYLLIGFVIMIFSAECIIKHMDDNQFGNNR